MSHRKGEITGYANEWDFPHLAELELLPPAMRTWLGILLPRRTYSPLWPTERRTPAVAEGLPVSRREPAMSQKSAVSATALLLSLNRRCNRSTPRHRSTLNPIATKYIEPVSSHHVYRTSLMRLRTELSDLFGS
jgi:hypothetical protein